MEDKDQSAERRWSSEFVRNRAEVITMTLIFYLLTHVEGDIKSIPFGVELGHAIPKGPLLIFVFIFLLYFLSSWMLRALIEFRDGNMLKVSADGFAAETSKFIKRLEESEAKWAGFELRELLEHIDKRMANHVSSFGESQNVAFDEYLDGFAQRAQGLIAFERKAASGAEAEKISNIFDTEKMAFGQFMHSQKGAWDREALRVRDGINEHVLKASEEIDSLTKGAVNNIRDHGPQIGESLGKIVAGIADMNRQLRNYRTAVGLNRVIYGFVLPWAFSVILLVVSLPQAFQDTSASFESALRCVVSVAKLDMSCLYRDKPVPVAVTVKVRRRDE